MSTLAQLQIARKLLVEMNDKVRLKELDALILKLIDNLLVELE